jgi:predicted site-specific integrase-resolvase
MAKSPNWIKESEAAQMIGISPETLRRYTKAGKLDISYTSVRGRNFQYDQNDIEKLLNKNAVLIHA